MTELHHFRTAYVAHNSRHDFKELTKLADNIVFASTGYEPEDTLASSMEEAMKDYDPRKDIIVPVGNVNSNLLMGAIAARKSANVSIPIAQNGMPEMAEVSLHITNFFVAVYKDTQYHVREIKLGGSSE